MQINFCPNCGEKVKQGANFCSNCGFKIADILKNQQKNSLSVQAKREKVLGESEKKNRLSSYLIVGVLVAFVIFMVIKSLPSYKNPIIEAQPKVATSVKYSDSRLQMYDIKAEVKDGKIVIPLNVVVEKKLVGFQYVKAGVRVPLLAYISPEGKVVTAISMCEPCNSERFHIASEEMVCNSCGTRWDLRNLNGISGACQKFPPDPIPSIVVGNEIQIQEEVVANWRRRI